MGLQEIPTSPANYEIWTTYAAGMKPDLSREIEARLPPLESGHDRLFTPRTDRVDEDREEADDCERKPAHKRAACSIRTAAKRTHEV